MKNLKLLAALLALAIGLAGCGKGSSGSSTPVRNPARRRMSPSSKAITSPRRRASCQASGKACKCAYRRAPASATSCPDTDCSSTDCA